VLFGSVLGNQRTISGDVRVGFAPIHDNLLRYQLLGLIASPLAVEIAAVVGGSGRSRPAGRTCRSVAVGFASQPNVPRDPHHIGETASAAAKPFQERRFDG